MDYLDQLSISPPEREKLRQLAAPTPAALLGMIRASTDAFSRFFGPERTKQLAGCLTELVGREENERLVQPAHQYPIQASEFAIGPAPPLPPPRIELAKRDRIFSRLQQLLADPHPTNQICQEIAACEAELNAILD